MGRRSSFLALVGFLVLARRRAQAGDPSIKSPMLIAALAASIALGVVSVYWAADQCPCPPPHPGIGATVWR